MSPTIAKSPGSFAIVDEMVAIDIKPVASSKLAAETVMMEVASGKSRRFAMYENIIKAMHDTESGIKLKNQKRFMKTIHSCFTAKSLIDWLVTYIKFSERSMAKLLAQKMFEIGYIFPLEYAAITDSDDQLMRFQTPFYWPSISKSVTDFEYAVYLFKLTLKKTSLASYETQQFGQLNNALKWRWEFVQQQAQETMRSYKEMSSMNKHIIDSQEAAFWWVHRPPPGMECMAQTVVDKEEKIDHRAIEAPKWAEGLSQLLHSPEGNKMYGDFLASEYSRENLDFWMECNQFKQFDQRTVIEMCRELKRIYNQFLVANAPREVNIPQGMRQVIAQKIEQEDVSCEDLEPSKAKIYELMNKDSYSRFLRSPEFMQLIAVAEATELIMA
eukprot:CFRG2979T1